jgi:hypothetical protein
VADVTYEQVEDGILAALADLRAPAGYLRALRAYNGEFTEEHRALEELVGLSPGVLVGMLESDYARRDAGGRRYRERVTFRVLALSKSYRGPDASRRGSAVVGEPPGLYQMVRDIRARLIESRVGLAIGALAPSGQNIVMRLGPAAAAAVDFKCDLDVSGTLAVPAGTPTLATVRAGVTLPPESEPRVEADIILPPPAP